MRNWDHNGFSVGFDGETISVGHHRGNPHSWAGGSCSLQEFLDGRYQSLIQAELGEEVLEELLALAKQPDERLQKELDERAAVISRWQEIPALETDIFHHEVALAPMIVDGYPDPGQRIELPGGFAWIHGEHHVAPPNTLDQHDAISNNAPADLDFDYDKLELPDGRQVLAPQYLRGRALFWQNHLYVVAGDDVHVLNTNGELTFTTRDMRKSHLIGSAVRIGLLGTKDNQVMAGFGLLSQGAHTALEQLLGERGLLILSPTGITHRAALLYGEA